MYIKRTQNLDQDLKRELLFWSSKFDLLFELCCNACLHCKETIMIDPRKMINKRMTTEDLSLLFLGGDILYFKDTEQFQLWLFVLNFPLLKPYIKLVGYETGPAGFVTIKFDLPFCLSIRYNLGIVSGFKPNGFGRFNYKLGYNKEHQTHVIDELTIGFTYPEARLLIRAVS